MSQIKNIEKPSRINEWEGFFVWINTFRDSCKSHRKWFFVIPAQEPLLKINKKTYALIKKLALSQIEWAVLSSPPKRGVKGVFIMKRIQYNLKLIEVARRLRSNSTKAEIKLWTYLKGKQLNRMLNLE